MSLRSPLAAQEIAAHAIATADENGTPAQEDPGTPPASLVVRLPATFYFGASDIDWTWRESNAGELALGFDMKGLVGDRTLLSAAFIRGPANIVSPLVIYGAYRPVARISLLNPNWGLTVGNLTSASHVLAGTALNADGFSVSVRRRLVAEFTLARPNSFGTGGGGHLVQGRFGVSTHLGTFAVVGSDMSRPLLFGPVASATVTAPLLDADVAELGELRRLLSAESRVRGWGLESDMRLGNAGTLTIRGGGLELRSQSGLRVDGSAGEARYAFTRRRLGISAYARHAPPSLPGTYVPGDSATVSATVPIAAKLTGFVRAYSNVDWLISRPEPLRSRGESTGLNYSAGTTRFMLQFSNRQLRSSDARFNSSRRTISGTVAVPLGPIEMDLQAEAGPAEIDSHIQTVQIYRMNVSVDDDARSVWLAGSYEGYGFQSPRARVDTGASFLVRGAELEVGAGYGTGQLLGNNLSAWGSIEMPVRRAFTLVAQVDYFRWDYGASPYLQLMLNDGPTSPWRLTIGARRTVSLPIPFTRRRQAR